MSRFHKATLRPHRDLRWSLHFGSSIMIDKTGALLRGPQSWPKSRHASAFPFYEASFTSAFRRKLDIRNPQRASLLLFGVVLTSDAGQVEV